jgi:uncharacterized protein YbjT (DUF2867 family)
MTILVTGATGTIGASTLYTFGQRHLGVSALVRNPEKTAQVLALGATPVLSTFEDQVSLQNAMTGIETIVLITPAGPAAEEQATCAIDAAKKSGVQKIVRISAIRADPNGPTNNTRAHGRTEAEIIASGLRYVFLRPNLFMQNLFMVSDQIRQQGQFSFATGAGRMGMIDTRDIAACAVECAISNRWDGQALELTGPEAISYFDVATTLGAAYGSPVQYEPVQPSDMYKMIEGAGWGEWMAALSRDYGQAYASNWGNFTTENVEQITGRPPRTFIDFAREVLLPALQD